MKRTKLSYGMVGGSKGAFIGSVHRWAIDIEETAKLVAGSFHPDYEESKKTGIFYGLKEDRIYRDYKEMAEKEAQRADKIDFVSIVTPNALHYEVAKAFVQAGINVYCEKPLCFEVDQAEELMQLAKEKGVLFAVSYSYTGYGMVKFAKEIIARGDIGEIINVNAEYLQDWLIDEIGDGNVSTNKLSIWRMDPKHAGASNCVGDIGTHINSTVHYMTGLKVKKVAAVLDRFQLDLDVNANILIEFDNGAHGVFSSSQICIGHYNGLVIRIFGTKGAIEWIQETPDRLKVTRKGEPEQIYHRGTGNVDGIAALRNHIPAGHPEGLVMAFANMFRAFQDALLKKINGEALSPNDLDFPTVEDGADSVRFIHAAVKSDKTGAAWVELESIISK